MRFLLLSCSFSLDLQQESEKVVKNMGKVFQDLGNFFVLAKVVIDTGQDCPKNSLMFSLKDFFSLKTGLQLQKSTNYILYVIFQFAYLVHQLEGKNSFQRLCCDQYALYARCQNQSRIQTLGPHFHRDWSKVPGNVFQSRMGNCLTKP